MISTAPPCILFECTNESLNAIINGLTPGREDNILAIGGAGNQAFAMLSYGSKVSVIDYNSYQLELIKKRRDSLKKFDFSGFLGISLGEAKLSRSRFIPLRLNLGSLTILEPQDLFDFLFPVEEFNKFYFSNATSYNPSGRISLSGRSLVGHLRDFFKRCKPGSLVYLSDGNRSEDIYMEVGFKIDKERRDTARYWEVGSWEPSVLFKP